MVGTRRFADRTALITGGGGDIGRAIAMRLSADGAAVAVLDASLERATRTANEVISAGGRAMAIGADVRSMAALEGALDDIDAHLPPVSLVVAAAGVIAPAPFLELGLDAWRATIDINLTGAFTTVQSAARRLVARRLPGAIVAISSVSARGPRPDTADYAASKAGVISLVRSAAVALAPQGIRVNAVCPGVVSGEMTQRIHEARAAQAHLTVEQSMDTVLARVALGRAADPAEVADTVVFLLSDEASYITGQALNVCGGLAFD